MPRDDLRVLPLGGQWQSFGRGLLAGVRAVVDSVEVDEHGPKALSATLTRDPRVDWPDLATGALLEYAVDGLVVWSGRIASADVDEADALRVQLAGEGAQADLDDDVMQRVYVHDDPSAWSDVRDTMRTWIGNYTAKGDVRVGSTVELSWASGTSVTLTIDHVAAVLDLGPAIGRSAGAARAVVKWERIGSETAYRLAVLYSRTRDFNAASAAGFVDLTSASGTLAVSIATAGMRYVALDLWRTGATRTTTADEGVRITSALVATSSAYESGNASALTADDVVADAAIVAGLDSSLVQAGSFVVPSFAVGPGSPREALEAVNALQAYHYAVNARRQLVYRPYPSAPELETVAPFAGAAQLSSDAVVSHVMVRARSVLGEECYGEAFAPTDTVVVSSAGPSNPSMDTVTTGWSAWTGYGNSADSTLARDTGTFASSPASLNVTPTTTLRDVIGAATTLSGLVVGRRYAVRVALKRDNASTAGLFWLVVDESSSGTDHDVLEAVETPLARFRKAIPAASVSTSWATYLVGFVATASTMTFGVGWLAGSAVLSTTGFHVDECRVVEPVDTAFDRAGAVRSVVLDSGLAMPRTTAETVASIYAANATRELLAGTLRVGPGDTRTVLGGAPVPPHALLLRFGELMRLARRRAPEGGGGVGRDGRIVSVRYAPADDVAEVALDTDRRALDAWLARLGAIAANRTAKVAS